MTKGKKWTAAEKAQIVLEGLRGETSIAELSRRHGFDQSQFYRWREAFLAGGTAALETRRKDPSQANLQRKLSQYERLVGKLVYQLGLFKKFFPGRS